MTGFEAHDAYCKALALAKQGDYAAARAVEMLPSDRVVIESRIEAAIANSTKERK